MIQYFISFEQILWLSTPGGRKYQSSFNIRNWDIIEIDQCYEISKDQVLLYLRNKGHKDIIAVLSMNKI